MTTSCVSRVKRISSELVYEAKAVTGEGSIWHPSRNTLFWVDIEGQTLYEYHPADKTCSSWRFDRMISTVVPETDTTVVVALLRFSPAYWPGQGCSGNGHYRRGGVTGRNCTGSSF